MAFPLDRLLQWAPNVGRTASWYLRSLVPATLRRGRTFHQTLDWLELRIAWTAEESLAWQLERTRTLLEHAEQQCKWYQMQFAKWGIRARDFVNFKDLQRFPSVTKEEIRDNLELFVAKDVDVKSLRYTTTAGSTGIPFAFYLDDKMPAIEDAFFALHWKWLGCHLDDTKVVLRGLFVGSADRLWVYKPHERSWYMSSYFLTQESVRKYVDKINRIRPTFFHVYPSSAELLANLMLEQKLQFDFRPRAVMCGSENLSDGQRERIELAFQAPVHSWYGQAERVCLAPWTATERKYAALPHYGLVELIDKDGHEVTQENATGEIVATGLHNYCMPLIRYKTKDLAVHTNTRAPEVPSARRFLSIEGRIQELVITKSGRLISMTAINMHDRTFEDIRQFQFFQKRKGEVILRVIPKQQLSADALRTMESSLVKKLGADMDLKIEVVESLQKTRSGKLRFLIQELPVAQWSQARTDNDREVHGREIATR